MQAKLRTIAAAAFVALTASAGFADKGLGFLKPSELQGKGYKWQSTMFMRADQGQDWTDYSPKDVFEVGDLPYIWYNVWNYSEKETFENPSLRVSVSTASGTFLSSGDFVHKQPFEPQSGKFNWFTWAYLRDLPAGSYVLTLTIDPDGKFADADRSDNEATFAFRINGGNAGGKAGDITFGVGLKSQFAIPDTGTCYIFGAEGLTDDHFCEKDWFGSEDHICCRADGIVDAEASAKDCDDNYWCGPISDMNMLYLTGWGKKSGYKTVDDMLAYFRKNPKLLRYATKTGDPKSVNEGKYGYDGLFDWFKDTTKIDLSGKVRTGNMQDKAGFLSALKTYLGSGGYMMRVSSVFLNVTKHPKWKGYPELKGYPVSHAVVCCGYMLDNSGELAGLFIIDSNNDQMTGEGGPDAPNTIIFCPVQWQDETDIGPTYAISGIWGEVSYLCGEYKALQNCENSGKGDSGQTQIDSTRNGVGVSLSKDYSEFAGYKAKGLPPGMKWNAATGELTGTPTKAGDYAIVFTKGAVVETRNLIVEGLPGWAQGTFNGTAEGGQTSGTATFTISAAGKISGKIVVGRTTCAFKCGGYDADSAVGDDSGKYVFTASGKVGRETYEVKVSISSEDGVTAVAEGTAKGFASFVAYRNIWKDKDAAEYLNDVLGVYAVQLDAGLNGCGYLSMIVGKGGSVKMSGKCPDGTTISASTTLGCTTLADPFFADIALKPSAYKSKTDVGYVSGRFTISDGAVSSGAGIDWVSFAPKASDAYGKGFQRSFDVVGAWWDKTSSLRDFYNNPALGNVDVPAIDVKVKYIDEEYNDNGKARRVITTAKESALVESVTDGKMSFSKATGVFKGSIGAKYVYTSQVNYITGEDKESAKTVKYAYEGIIVPKPLSAKGFFKYKATAYDENDRPYSYVESRPVEIKD